MSPQMNKMSSQINKMPPQSSKRPWTSLTMDELDQDGANNDLSPTRPSKRSCKSPQSPSTRYEMSKEDLTKISDIVEALVKKYKKELVLEDISTDEADMIPPLPSKYPRASPTEIKETLESEFTAQAEYLHQVQAERQVIWYEFQDELHRSGKRITNTAFH